MPMLKTKFKKTWAYQEVEKWYDAIFTCFSSRALYIELAGSLSTEHFILELFRFISRRSYPKSITSDNDTNLVGPQQDLSEALQK